MKLEASRGFTFLPFGNQTSDSFNFFSIGCGVPGNYVGIKHINDIQLRQLGGNNSEIPENGLVLSGHGSAASFLIANSFVGAEVVIDEALQEVQIKNTPESLAEAAKQRFSQAEIQYQTAATALLDIDYTEAINQLEQARATVAALDTQIALIQQNPEADNLQFDFLDLLAELDQQILLAEYAMTESRVIEARGLWHRPTENTLAAVQATLEELQSQKINILFLESFYSGYTIASMPEGSIIEQNPQFKNNNYG